MQGYLFYSGLQDAAFEDPHDPGVSDQYSGLDRATSVVQQEQGLSKCQLEPIKHVGYVQ